ncbi:MAG: Ig-like domain-containing protein, partial [Pseudomonadales bacterium]|nr:Ig-like domain-containing protein [Pseudomonadales bacterium]
MTQGSLPKVIIAALMGMLLVACGGGGGSGNTGLVGDGSTGTEGDTDTGTPTIQLRLVDDTGDAEFRLTGNETATAEATVLDASGDPLSGIVVSYSTTIGQLTPPSGTALTNALGFAEITVSAGTTSGAGTITATATVDGTVITSNTVGFEVDAEATGSTVDDDVIGLQLGTCTAGTGPTDCTSDTTTTFSQGTMSLSSTQISAGGTATVELVVVDINLEPLSGVEISFTTNCASRTDANTGEALASITDSATTNSIGAVSANYQANGCEGNDTITAREPGTGKTATGTINEISTIIGSLTFIRVSED